MKMLRYLFAFGCFCFLLIFPSTLAARLRNLESISSKTYSTRHGLPSNFVSFVTQDYSGYIWICTQLGLARYDGQEFQIFDQYPDKTSLDTRFVQIESNGTIWVATTTHLLCGKAGNFEKFDLFNDSQKHTISAMILDERDVLWLAVDSNHLFSVENGKLNHHQYSSDIDSLRIYNLSCHPESGVGVLTNQGLFHFSKNEWIPFSTPKSIKTPVMFVFMESKSSNWIYGSDGELVHMIGSETETYQLTDPSEKLNIYEMLKDSHGGLWIASSKGIFFIKNKKVDQFTVRDHLSSDIIYSICMDREGLLWYGSDNGMGKVFGLQFRQIRPTQELPFASVMDMVIDNDGSVWCATGGGVVRLNEKSQRLWSTRDGLKDDYCMALLPFKKGVLVSNAYGLFLISENRVSSILQLDNLAVYNLVETPDSRVFCACDRGVFELVGNQLISLSDSLHLTENSEVNSINFDHAGNLWVLTEDSGAHLYRYPSIQEIPIEGSALRTAYAFFESADQTIWIGASNGVFQFDGIAMRLLLNSTNGLLSDNIWSIQQDSEQNMWFATSKGLSCLKNGRCINYDVEDGLSGDDFIANCTMKDSENRLWFGGSGITLVDPEYIQPLNDPSILLKSAISDGVSVTSGQKLPHGMNYIEFRFTCLSYANESRNKYRYQLIGFDAFKSQLHAQPFVRYTNLGTGKYTLIAEAANRDGSMTPEPASFIFEVLPAWWELIHIRSGLVTLTLMLIVGIVRYRNARIQAQAVRLQIEVNRQTEVNKKQVEKLQEQRDRLETLTITDDMTKIFNRRFFFRQLTSEWQRHLRYRRPLSVILFDIDHFKGFNDTFGHAIGDEVLISVAKTMALQVRRTDSLARYGGEEFAVLLPETEMKTAIEVAERIRAAVENLTVFSESIGNLNISISGGIATRSIEAHPLNPDALMQEADMALYRAKQTGRNRIIHYSQISSTVGESGEEKK